MPDSTRPVAFVPAFVEWRCPDQNATTYIGHRHPRPVCQVAFEIRFEESERAAFFKLRLPVALKACAKKTNIFVFILPERILSLDTAPGSDANIPEPVRRGLVQANACSSSEDITRLQFSLSKPSVLVVPASTSLAPATTASGTILNMLQSLAQVTDFTLLFPSKHMSHQRLSTLCSMARDGGLKPVTSQLDLTSLNGGKGADIVEGVDLYVPTPADSPPSYDELAPSPPPPPAESSKARVPDSHTQGPRAKRPRLDPSPEDLDAQKQALEDLVASLCKKAFDGFRSELRREMQDRLKELEDKLEARIDYVAEQLRDEAHDDREDLQDRTDEQIDLRIDEQLMGIKEDVRDHVVEEMKNVEDRIKDSICSASLSLNF
ncbi:hypothetical protein GTA08_BOTSDO01197 [Botryosphaeria dothidea]|uniref:Uncharacterized protein n=1 Tax=Botryosphaeria dothidea TaxID=55169 RepID=A0A8H4N7Q7_9PEZI|nr:hypothetical protein GTA08_BOTSDO01197 [Botryosphaeria dothidea]